MVVIFPSNNFESAVILILVVAIPFFILVLTIHILYGGMYTESENCQSICDLKITNPTFFVPIEDDDLSDTDDDGDDMRKREINPSILEEYDEEEEEIKKPLLNPSIATLIEFTNSQYDQRFRCALPLISVSWALTTDKCVRPNEKKLHLRIRLGSNYWDKGGILQKIQRIIHQKSVRVNPVAISFFQPEKINYRPLMIPTSEVLYPKQPQLFIFLPYTHELIDVNVTLFPPNKCRTGYNEIILCGQQNTVPCKIEENYPLVDEQYLLALHMSSHCNKNIIYFFDIYHISEWIEDIVGP